MKHFAIGLILTIPLTLVAEEESTTICIVGLSGYAAYELEENKFAPDKISDAVVVQVSTRTGVSVMGWPPGSCSLLGDLIVCLAKDTIETYLITDEGDVYYTKTTSNPSFQGTKALVGQVGEC